MTTASRPTRLAPTLALLLGLGGTAFAAQDIDVTVAVDSTGQTQGGVLVTSSGTVVYTVTFSEAVFPAYFKPAAPGRAIALTPAVGADIFDIFNFGSTPAGATKSVRQISGTQLAVTVSGLADGESASLAVVADKVFDAATGVDGNKAVAAKTVRFMDMASAYTASISTASDFGFLNAPVLIGDFSDAGDFNANPLYPDYVVQVKEGATLLGNAYTAADGAWFFTPTGPLSKPIGYFTLTAVPADAAGNVSGSTVNKSFYVWNEPTIATIEQTDDATPATFANSIKVNDTKPAMTGTVGLPKTLAGGGELEVKIDIFYAGTTNPAIAQITKNHAAITAGATANTDTATWSITDGDFSTDLLNNTDYDVVVTMKAVTTNPSPNSITTTKQIRVETSAATAPTLSVAAATTPNHLPVITIDGVGVVPTTDTIKMYVSKNAGAFTLTTGTVAAKAGGTATDATWVPTTALTDGDYQFKARWINAAGKESTDSTAVDLEVETPVPVLSAVVSPAAGGAVSGTAAADGNVQYLLANLTPKITVGGGLDPTKGTLTVYRLDRGTNGTDSATPYTIDYTAIDGAITAGASPGTVVAGTLAAGVWTPDAAFTAGRWSLYAKWTDNDDDNGTGASATDAVSKASNVFNMRVLASVVPPTFTGINLANQAPNALPTNLIVTTSSGSVVLAGTGNPGATLKLTRNGSSLPTKVIGTDGTWTYEFSTDGDANAAPLLSGTNTILATQLDLSGTESSATAQALVVNVSGSAPAAPRITTPLTGAKVADITPALSGTAPANTTVNIYKASTATLEQGADDILITARSPKAATITLVDPPTNNASLAVAVSGTDVTVTLATDGSSAITSTVAQVVAAINANTSAAALMRASLTSGTGTGTALAVASTNLAASSRAGEVTVTSSGTWTKELGTLKNGTSAAATTTLPAGAEPGTKYNLFATTVSASGIEGAASTDIDLYVVTPTLDVALAAIAKGTGADYTASAAAAKGASIVKVVSGGVNGTVYVGDYVTFADNVVNAINDAASIYKITALTKTASSPDAYTLTVTPALKDARSTGAAMTILANSDGPTSGKSSLSSILLTATFTSGGNPVDEILTSGFTKDKITVTNGTISSITKGNGLPGQLPTNVWKIAVTPNVAEGVNLTVNIPEGKVATQPGYILSSFEVTNEGSNYTAANTTLTVGGGSAAQVTWTDNGDGGGTATDGKIQVGELDLVNPGYGFTAAPATITVQGGPGSGAIVPTSIPFTTGAGFTTGTYALTTQGSGYVSGVAKVAFVGGGTPSVPAAATATVSAGKVTQIQITTAGTGYTSRPTIVITSGSGAIIRGITTAGTVVFNNASNTYSQAIDRIRPVVAWKGAADTSSALYNVALSGAPAANAALTGVTYVNLASNPADTQFKVRASFSSNMSRELVVGDLVASGATILSVTDVDGLTDNSVNDTNRDFDILLKRNTSTATAMTVGVKALTDMTDDTTPAQTPLASSIFSATVVAAPTAPVIASTVGAAAPTSPARTTSYPCTVRFVAPVTGFTADSLTVTNGVIAKFAGTGSSYTFTLVPGEGEVTVQYDSTVSPILDVAGNAIPSSNTLIRVLDSTQPTVASVASPAFGVATIKPLNGAAAYNRIPVRVTFSEAPKSFPSSAAFATLASNGSQLAIVAPANVTGTGPQVVADTGGKTWAFDLVIPATGSGTARLVLPGLLVPDQAGNQGAASEVMEIKYDHAAGTAVDVVTSPVFANG